MPRKKKVDDPETPQDESQEAESSIDVGKMRSEVTFLASEFRRHFGTANQNMEKAINFLEQAAEHVSMYEGDVSRGYREPSS